MFHCQQLAEKSLKGFWAWHDRPFRKTHNLVEIGQQCVSVDASLEDVVRPAATLTEYAWKFCYPGEPEQPLASEARRALDLARNVYDAVLSRLPDAVRPWPVLLLCPTAGPSPGRRDRCHNSCELAALGVDSYPR